MRCWIERSCFAVSTDGRLAGIGHGEFEAMATEREAGGGEYKNINRNLRHSNWKIQ